jgi:hypothetical protein
VIHVDESIREKAGPSGGRLANDLARDVFTRVEEFHASDRGQEAAIYTLVAERMALRAEQVIHGG